MNSNKLSLCIISLLLLTTLSSAYVDWKYSDASGKVCFNLTSDGYIYGRNSNAYYTVPIVQLYNNKSFTDGNMFMEYANQPQQSYKITTNGSNVFLAFIAWNNSAVGSNTEYCIYSGGSDNTGTSDMQAGYYSATGGYFEALTMINISEPTNITKNGIVGQVFGGDGTYDLAYESNTTHFNIGTFSYGTNIQNLNMLYKYDYYIDSAGGCPVPPCVQPTNHRKVLIYYDNYTKLFSYASSGIGGYILRVTTDGKDGNPFVPPSWNNVVWSLQTRNGEEEQNFTATTIDYDFRDANISIQSPTWGTSYQDTDVVPISVVISSNYDNCSYQLNDAQFYNKTNVTYPPAFSYLATLANVSIGTNQIKVSCYRGGIESHNYVTFYSSVGNPEVVFYNGLGISLSSLCNGTVISELGKCDEWYKKTIGVTYGAVVCQDLNSSINYSCVASGTISNFSKNGYTIFYSPNTQWNYSQNDNLKHVGALFYYNNLKLDTGIELVTGNRFIYIPAQNRSGDNADRDCGIWYLNAGNCSYREGVTLNDGSIYVSDRHNNWYSTAGLGFTNYNENLSQIVLNTQVVPATELEELVDFGFFTRTNCYAKNGTYTIYIQNTMNQLYGIVVVGTNGSGSVNYSLNSTTLSLMLPTSGIDNIVITGAGRTLCELSGNGMLFLPISFRLPFSDGMGGILPKILILMTIVLSTIIPYALFGAYIFNDLYHVIDAPFMATLTIFAIIGGLVNNINPFERGIKHMVILLAIVMAYIVSMAEFQEASQLNVPVYTEVFNGFRGLMYSQNPIELSLGLVTFIFTIFLKIIFLPTTIIALIYDLIHMMSLPLYTAFQNFRMYLEAGAMLYFYLKAYEVISNRFRIV